MTIAEDKTLFYSDLYEARGEAITYTDGSGVPVEATALVLRGVGEHNLATGKVIYRSVEIRVRRAEIPDLARGATVHIGTAQYHVDEVTYESQHETRAILRS